MALPAGAITLALATGAIGVRLTPVRLTGRLLTARQPFFMAQPIPGIPAVRAFAAGLGRLGAGRQLAPQETLRRLRAGSMAVVARLASIVGTTPRRR